MLAPRLKSWSTLRPLHPRVRRAPTKTMMQKELEFIPGEYQEFIFVEVNLRGVALATTFVLAIGAGVWWWRPRCSS